MNNKELQALRKLLMLEVNEAAEHVGGVRARTWYYWEEGRNPIPPEVAQKMTDLVGRWGAMSARAASHPQLLYFTTFEDYASHTTTPEAHKNVLSWRISQSVAAYFHAEGMADLI